MTAQQLKNSILQMAVQGKLVPQDPNDEPASVLLERIKAEKKALIKAGKIKNDKHESVIVTRDKVPYEIIDGEERCIADEVPFELPEGWELIRLNDIGIYRKGPFGSSLTKSMFVPKGIDTVKVYEQKNAINKDYTLGDYYITRKYYEDKMQSFTVSAGDIIVSCAGTIGETYVMPDNIELGIINQALMRMTIFAPINIDYFLMYFDYVLKNSAKESSKGSAIKNIPPFEIFKQLFLPLPPLAEQHRIVARIEELLPYIEKYGKADEKLTALNATFPEALKKSILQEAVQGKLVPQNPDDEPASVLLEHIKAEKQALIKAGKIKKDKPLPPITDEEIPFDIPESWCWCRLGQLVTIRGGKRIPAGRTLIKEPNEHIYIRVTDMQNGTILDNDLHYVPDDIFPLISRYIIEENDIYIVIVGSTIGKTGTVPPKFSGMCLTENAARLTPILIYKEYLHRIISSSFAQQQFYDKTKQVGQPKLAINRLETALIPLPPLAEQKRIVAKIEELLPYIEKFGKAEKHLTAINM